MEAHHRNFHHPFRPYKIQVDLMNAIYDCIERKQVGLFESPTGTGKSLSLLCSSLTWLRDHQHDYLDESVTAELEEEPAWVLEYLRKEKEEALIRSKRELEGRLAKIRAKELRQKQRYERGEPRQKKLKKESGADVSSEVQDEAKFLLDYDSASDEQRNEAGVKEKHDAYGGLSMATFDLLSKLGMITKESTEEDDSQPMVPTKIFYCSRTHSQLTQFAHEIRRIQIPSVISDNQVEPSDVEAVEKEGIKHLSLGSRKNLCINPGVSKLGDATSITEKCLELQQPNTGQGHRCKFLPNKENQPLVNDFRDHTLASIRDIEDLGDIGKRIGICPYYASRAAVQSSEIVTLPYPMLLQKSAREALEISLKDHIVIVDEAHNLVDAISSIHSTTVSLAQLKRSEAQLRIYLQKFRNKLKGKNRVYVAQLLRLIDSISTYLEDRRAEGKATDGIVGYNELLSGKGVDQINLNKLMRYLQESKLARKVEGYLVHTESSDDIERKTKSSVTPVLTQIQIFLQSLSNPAAEGRFFFARIEGNDMSLKYSLLDPMHHFKDIVEDARAVILVGGTMSPMDDFKRHLFSYLDEERLITLSCGHVIPDENLLAWPIKKGPSGLEFDFRYGTRDSTRMIDELGECIIRLAAVIPDGLVVFFPSYAYLKLVTVRWDVALAGQESVTSHLSRLKKTFRESKAGGIVEDVLKEYTNAVNNGGGALLLSVVGGKMSEGINFSDRLGRGVVIVGLPFPNAQSAEWKARMEYIENSCQSRGGTAAEGKVAAQEFYENACMRAVNQSIGRAIRHQKDFASVVMLDGRYQSSRIQNKLPGWIKKGLVKNAEQKSFAEVEDSIDRFFEGRNE